VIYITDFFPAITIIYNVIVLYYVGYFRTFAQSKLWVTIGRRVTELILNQDYE